METGLTYTLERVAWQFFGTLSFKSVKVVERVRLCMWFSLARKLCRWFEVPWRKFVWALRQEPGEITGRLHFHFLCAGVPPAAVQVATCFSIMAQWEKIGGGIARVREYDSRKHGLEYIVKCLGTNNSANLYEVGKFSSSSDGVMLSNSIWNPSLLSRVSVSSM